MKLRKSTIRKKWFGALFSLIICLLAQLDTHAQSQVNVSGIVSGPDGNPIAGVTVSLEGTNSAVATDNAGRYALNNVASGGTLVFQAVGYETISIRTKERRVGTECESKTQFRRVR